METRKLYYEDPFQKGFATTVVSCDEVKGGYAVVLAETAFYPEGGGQPYDTGVLGEANVLEVHEKNGVITHLCDKPFEVGKSVSGKIDWARRFDHMQQHSGEHICSGLICERFHCDNVGFHMGADVVTIDFNADIPWEELLEIEAAANGLLTLSEPAHGPQPVAEPGRRNIRLYPDAGAVLEDFLRRASPESIKRLREAGLEL